MAKVVLTARLPGDFRELLAGHSLIEPDEDDQLLSQARILSELATAEAIIPTVWTRIDEALLARAPKLRIVANYAVGFDNIDLAATRARGIFATNTPDVLTSAVADLTMALLLAAARRVPEGDALVRRGEWSGWYPGFLLGRDLEGARLGIVGKGRIGGAVARRAAGFGMRVESIGSSATRAEVDTLFAECDIVTLHCPAVDATRGIASAERLMRMKPGAILVNTSRGALVDEEGLLAALDRGPMSSAGLDVFVNEPAIDVRIRAHPRIVLTPHIGSSTIGARTNMARVAARNVAVCLAGARPPNIVNGL